MISYQDKIRILASIPELSRTNRSYDRVNFVFPGARTRRKVVAREIALTGNGYLFVGFLEEFRHLRDARGFINIDRHVQGESELRLLLDRVIESYM
ncbi:MAG: hypothetical protein FD169_2080 [Bacillota bacterium]|nr:MAG: hypothetical protein FD169_2080 [Bacillota bacterium]